MLKHALPYVAVVLSLVLMPPSARAVDPAHEAIARHAIERGVEYLLSTQNDDGSWTPGPGPAVTAMALQVMIESGDVQRDDPAAEKALGYILTFVQEDGGIHAGFLGNYNTSISLTALDLYRDRPGMEDTIKHAQDYLRGIQWDGQAGPDGQAVDESHPFYGGAGYGKHGRPDMSNTQFMLQGLYDSGLDCKDPAFVRAVAFISRCQGIDENDLLADLIEKDGGFIYATSINKDLVGVPESKANPEQMDEALQGAPVSGLRTYGSMTYAGFKSYLYAQLHPDDPRVTAALGWIERNYTLDRNPGLPETMKHQGLYYYYMTFARALSTYGKARITTHDGEARDWAGDLIQALAERQDADGSWVNEADRWMEGDRNLVTCYALIALIAAVE